VLSAFESPELERQAREAGAFAFLDKGTMARRCTGCCWERPCTRSWPPTAGRPGREPGPCG